MAGKFGSVRRLRMYARRKVVSCRRCLTTMSGWCGARGMPSGGGDRRRNRCVAIFVLWIGGVPAGWTWRVCFEQILHLRVLSQPFHFARIDVVESANDFHGTLFYTLLDYFAFRDDIADCLPNVFSNGGGDDVRAAHVFGSFDCRSDIGYKTWQVSVQGRSLGGGGYSAAFGVSEH